MKYILLTVLALILLLLAIIIIRTLIFKPKKTGEFSAEEVAFDKQKAVDSLRELVRCKTVSFYTREQEDEAEFDKLVSLLPQLFPNVFKACEFIKLEERGLLLKWQGESDKNPSVMMSHYDVVPADEKNWSKPAFEGVIENGVLWGRGTLDTKVTMNAALSAAETLIADGFVPKNDVYFAFSGNEEVNGLGAVKIVEYFEQNSVTPALVLDEGGAVVENVFPGVTKPSAMIGIAEKGMVDVLYKTVSSGGHASAPKPNTPIDILAKACLKIKANPFKAHITKPVAQMFDTLGRHSSFLYRMIFANLWCFSGLLDIICKKSGGEINALMRTTVAFTRMQGSKTNNVIPTEATMVSNIRLNPEDTVDSALEYLKKSVGNPLVEIIKIQGTNPSRISKTYCDAYNKVAYAVSSTWKGAITTPYLMVQCSDSRHYGRISDKVYRFSAMDLTSEERASIHGNDEGIRLETIEKSVEFYIRLLKQC